MENDTTGKRLLARGGETKMDTNTLAVLVYQYAKRDVFNWKGRIIVSDFVKAINQPNLKAEDIINAFKAVYPQYQIEQRTENVILISFK
jgi:hypothetical protein